MFPLPLTLLINNTECTPHTLLVLFLMEFLQGGLRTIRNAQVLVDHYLEECRLELLKGNSLTATQHGTVLVLLPAFLHPGYFCRDLEGKCPHLHPIQDLEQAMNLSVNIWQLGSRPGQLLFPLPLVLL